MSGVAFSFPEGTPVVTTSLIGSDDAFVNPGAVIGDGGTLHMFANAFTQWPGKVDFYHLTSTDGITWTPAADNPIFTSDEVPWAQPGADVSTGFVDADGNWVLIIESVALADPWRIGRATAPGPGGPWAIENEPVVVQGESGTWDAGGVAWPSVVRSAGGWAMYYAGRSALVGGTSAIGLATSSDGETWIKHAGPILTAQADWELGSLDRPRVVATPDVFTMVYAGQRLTDRGLASSVDGVEWQRVGDAPAITQDDFPVSGRSWDAALVYADELLSYYLEIGGGTASTGTAVFRATAPYQVGLGA